MSRTKSSRAELLADLQREIREASGLGTVFSQTIAERFGLTSSDLECLDLIGFRGGVVTAGELAQATGLTTGAVTGIIDRLEKAGFAKRERDAQDRRKVLVRLLPAAERRIAPLYASMAQAMDELMSRYTDAELSLLQDFISKSHQIMVDAIGKLRTKPAGTRRKADTAQKF
jgi:DNA-binding MarR family transcriptional regulator